jgi:hypothetical protein
VAIASTATVLVIVAWAVVIVVASPATSNTPTTRAAVHSSASAPQQASPSPEVAPASAPPPAQPGTVGPAPTAPSSEQPPPPPGAAIAAEQLVPDDTPRQSVPVPPPVPVPPTGPVPCTNAMLTVGAEIDRPEHRVVDRPVLRLVVTNVSDQPCIRDLDSARQEIVVWGPGGARIWSSNDCVNASTSDLRTLVPGQPVAFAVRWAGRTSTPGCAAPRTVVPPGDYNVMARVDNAISAATPFRRLP